MKGIIRQLKRARAAAEANMRDQASHGRYAAGMASEGYAGGYRDALTDVELALSGVTPNTSRFWPGSRIRK